MLLATTTGLAITIGAAVWAYPSLVLWVLGPKYSGLTSETQLFFATSSFQMISQVVWGINASRGWLRGNWLIVPTSIAAQVLAVLLVDVSTIRGALVIGGAALIPQAVVNIGMMIRGLQGKGIYEQIEGAPQTPTP